MSRIKGISSAVAYKPKTMTAEVRAQREARAVELEGEIEAILKLVPAQREAIKVWHETDTSGYAYGMPTVRLNQMNANMKQLKRERSAILESIRFVDRATEERAEKAAARKAARKS